MQRTKLADRTLPAYTKGEEIFNMVSHIVGGALGVTALVLCVVFAALNGNVYGVIGGAIYGSTMIALYALSSIYHGLSPKLMAKKVMQVIDHCAIYFLIAGTYTPITLCNIREHNTALGWTIFGVIWGMAALGVTLTAIDLKKYSKFSMVCYLGMGWCIVLTAKLLPKLLGLNGVNLLVLGGVAYTVGAVLYGIGKKKKYAHSIFHLFVVLGSIFHFFCILFYVM